MDRWSRIELTPLLDILLISLLILSLQQTTSHQDALEQTNDQLKQVQSRLDRTRYALSVTNIELDEAQQSTDEAESARQEAESRRQEAEQRLREAEAESLIAQAEAQRLAEVVNELGSLDGLTAEESAVVAQILRTEITVVQFRIRGDAIRSYAEIPAHDQIELDPPVELTRLVYDDGSLEENFVRAYRGSTIARLEAVLENSYHQDGPADQTFWVFLNDGGNTCVALSGLYQEIQGTEMSIVLPRSDCP